MDSIPHINTQVNIINDNSTFYMYTPHNSNGLFGNTNLYNSWSVLVNDEPGFSGHSGDWVHSSMAWYTIPFDKRTGFPPDTMRLRFNFVSDNIEQNREGWMIDQIRLYSIDLGYGIQEYLAGRSHSYFFPNPATDKITIETSGETKEGNLSIVNIQGQELITRQLSENKTVIDISTLPNGVYFMRVTNDKTVEVGKIIKQ
jgi:Secretion system C-terminal sorting domain